MPLSLILILSLPPSVPPSPTLCVSLSLHPSLFYSLPLYSSPSQQDSQSESQTNAHQTHVPKPLIWHIFAVKNNHHKLSKTFHDHIFHSVDNDKDEDHKHIRWGGGGDIRPPQLPKNIDIWESSHESDNRKKNLKNFRGDGGCRGPHQIKGQSP